MGNIKEKVEMELKPFETMCDTTTEHLKQMINGSEVANADEILTVSKVLSEIIDMKKDIVEICYKKQIMDAMEESDFDEYKDMVKGYAEPYGKGRMKMDNEFYHQRDMDYPKKMYYTDGNSSSNMTRDSREGISGEMRKTFVESKQINGKNSEEMENLEEYMNTLDSDMMQLKVDMTPSEKQMAYNKLMSLATKMKQ